VERRAAAEDRHEQAERRYADAYGRHAPAGIRRALAEHHGTLAARRHVVVDQASTVGHGSLNTLETCPRV
jgi:hypothetical protein